MGEKQPQSEICVDCKNCDETGKCSVFEESPGVLASCDAKEPRDPVNEVQTEPEPEPAGEDCEALEGDTEVAEVEVEDSNASGNDEGCAPGPVCDAIDESKALSGKSIAEERELPRATVDFSLNEFVELQTELDEQRIEIYKFFHKGGDGVPITDIKIAWRRDGVSCSAVTTMPPRKIKSETIKADTVHENGDIRLVVEAKQVGIPFTEQPRPEFIFANDVANSLQAAPEPNFFQIFTQSAIKLLQLCPKKFNFRYIMGLVPQSSKSDALYFGTLIHKCLDTWHGPSDEPREDRVAQIKELINSNFQDRDQDRKQRLQWHYARAMMRAYSLRYPFGSETWRTIETEKFFSGPILNPETGEELPWALYAGLVDLYVEDDFGKIIPDHKTASSISSEYLEGLPDDLQLTSYALYVGQQEDVEIGRVIYNIIAKPKIKQDLGETEEEYQVRYEQACAKAKSGKSSAKRKMPQTDDEFQAQLDEWFSAPDKLHREELLVDIRQFDEVRRELWNLAQLYLHLRTTDNWPRNREACHEYGKCGYYDVCMARPEEVDQAIELYLRPEPPHSEIIQFLDPKYGGTKGVQEEYDYPVSFDLPPEEGGE